MDETERFGYIIESLPCWNTKNNKQEKGRAVRPVYIYILVESLTVEGKFYKCCVCKFAVLTL